MPRLPITAVVGQGKVLVLTCDGSGDRLLRDSEHRGNGRIERNRLDCR